MKKFNSLKCPICGKVYKEVGTFGNHMRNEHPGTIPEDWSDLRYAYFVHTGRSHGKCRECGGDTEWNETTGSYTKICSSEACKKQYRDRFMAAMRSRYGKSNMLEDPNYRERMLTGRRISGEYTFSDGGKIAYMGKLEKAFLVMMDQFFRFPSSDIMSPSPNRYNYYYENPNDPDHTGTHIYVPDFWIPSCNLEIEIKSPDNQRPRNLMVDVVRDAQKDLFMIKDPTVNYVKIYEDDYHVLFQVFADIAEQNQTGVKKPIKYISRSLLTSLYRDYIPDEYLKILDGYIYKYSDKSVMKRVKANESDAEQILIEDLPVEESDDTDEEITAFADDVYHDAEPEEEIENSEDDDDLEPESVGVNPLMYYMMNEYAPKNSAVTESFSLFNLDDSSVEKAQEGLFGLFSGNDDIDTSKIDGRAAVKYGKWRDKLFGGSLAGGFTAKAFTKVTIANQVITIKGINANLLLYRIKEKYSEAKLKYIFQYRYNEKSWKMYQKKKIGKGDMKIDYVYAPEFFCLELVELFRELGVYYHDASYTRIAQLIYQESWLSKADNTEVPELGLEPLSHIALDLLPHQKTFIQLWPKLKHQLNTNGYILAFQPGKGKTLTAIGLSECIKAPKVYIVCPNNLKDNWALEIKKYFTKYQEDEKLWMRDVCILGTQYGDPKTARYIITNNENIKLMTPVVEKNPDAMLILDECHNFRNFGGGRSKELFALADKIQSHNVLCVSATPIKASPAEITPALRLIDPTFNDEAATMYSHCFDLSDTMAMSLVTKRFGKVIYRPADAEVDLPEKNVAPLPMTVSHDDRYYMTVVHDEIIAEFKRRHAEWLNSVGEVSKKFSNDIHHYTMSSKRDADAYLNWVFTSSNSLRGGNDEREFHELSIKEFKEFIEKNIVPNPNCPASEAERLTNIQNEFITAAKRSMGQAVGMILPPRRSEMFIQMYDENRQMIYNMIRNRGKKTIIFSTMVPVVKHIAKDLNDFGIGAVSISGDTKDRLNVLTKFREDPNTLVMVATSWCLGVGVTLTEASQMFFFGAPWRSTDFEQASDRIWRIGQTDKVDIWTAKLKSSTRAHNLSDRMQDILDWSAKMFGSAITTSEIDGTPDNMLVEDKGMEAYTAVAEYGTYRHLKMMNDMMRKDFAKIRETDEETFITQNPGQLAKSKRGTALDFMAYADFLSRSYGFMPDSYIVYSPSANIYHAFVLIANGDRFIYPEAFLDNCAGVYEVRTPNEVASFLVNELNKIIKYNPNDWMLIFVKSYYGRYGENLESVTERIRSRGKKIPFRFNPSVTYLEEIPDDATESFNMNIDGVQYDIVEDESRIAFLNRVHEIYYSYRTGRAGVKLQLMRDDCGGYAHNPCTYIQTEWSQVFDLYQTLNKAAMDMNCYDSAPKVLMLHLNTDEGIGHAHAGIDHPLVFVPFSDGALYIETAFSERRDNIYYVTDPHIALSACANWILTDNHLLESSPSHCKDSIHVSATIVPLNKLGGDYHDNADRAVTFNVNYEPLCSELHEVEVMNYGWTIHRY